MSALHVGFHIAKAGERETPGNWRPWLDQLRRASGGRRYEPVVLSGDKEAREAVKLDALGDVDELIREDIDRAKVDAKLGLGGDVETVLLVE